METKDLLEYAKKRREQILHMEMTVDTQERLNELDEEIRLLEGSNLTQPLSKAELDEYYDLKAMFEVASLGDRPQSPAAAKLKRYIELDNRLTVDFESKH